MNSVSSDKSQSTQRTLLNILATIVDSPFVASRCSMTACVF